MLYVPYLSSRMQVHDKKHSLWRGSWQQWWWEHYSCHLWRHCRRQFIFKRPLVSISFTSFLSAKKSRFCYSGLTEVQVQVCFQSLGWRYPGVVSVQLESKRFSWFKAGLCKGGIWSWKGSVFERTWKCARENKWLFLPRLEKRVGLSSSAWGHLGGSLGEFTINLQTPKTRGMGGGEERGER